MSRMTQVQVFLDEEDLHKDKPMYEYILRYLMHNDIMGATMFKGYMGFGAQRRLYEPRKFASSDPLPVLIVFVDTEPKIARVLEHLASIVRKGIMVSNSVERIEQHQSRTES